MSELCGFLTLPLEVREQIYTYLCGNRVIHIEVCLPKNVWCYLGARTEKGRPIDGIEAMLLISRQVTREVTHVLYSTNQFCFHSAPELRLFNDRIPIRHLASVRSIKLELLLRYLPEEWTSDVDSKCSISQLAPRMPNLVDICLNLNLVEGYMLRLTRQKPPSRVLRETVESSTVFPNLKQGTVVLDISGSRCFHGDGSNLSKFEQWILDELERGRNFLAGNPVELNLYIASADPYDPRYEDEN